MLRIGILLIAAVLFLASCSHLEYNAETRTITYWRIGNQELQGLKVTKEGEVTSVALESQSADNPALAEILVIVKELLRRMP